jgi:hypothetical protein
VYCIFTLLRACFLKLINFLFMFYEYSPSEDHISLIVKNEAQDCKTSHFITLLPPAQEDTSFLLNHVCKYSIHSYVHACVVTHTSYMHVLRQEPIVHEAEFDTYTLNRFSLLSFKHLNPGPPLFTTNHIAVF